MSVNGHIRKRKKIHHGKEICLECECLTKNCLPDCSGEHRYYTSNSFRPPKRGSNEWKKIRAAIRKCGLHESRFANVFGRHTLGMGTKFHREVYSRRMREQAYLNHRMELEDRERARDPLYSMNGRKIEKHESHLRRLSLPSCR